MESGLIYEAFQCHNLEEGRLYSNFVLSTRSIIANEVEEIDSETTDIEVNQEESAARPDIDILQIKKHSFPLLPENCKLKEYFLRLAEQHSEAKRNGYLQFDSNFECGNLNRVYAKSKNEYDLYVNSDTNTFGRCQWFYFLITNTYRGKEITVTVPIYRHPNM